jgi:CRISPR-associated protein Cas2
MPIPLSSGDDPMHILITYDVATSTDEGRRRLRRVAKACLDYGQRVQNSVFECKIDTANYVVLKQKILEILDLDHDSVRFYNLGKIWDERVEHSGTKPSLNMDQTLIV